MAIAVFSEGGGIAACCQRRPASQREIEKGSTATVTLTLTIGSKDNHLSVELHPGSAWMLGQELIRDAEALGFVPIRAEQG